MEAPQVAGATVPDLDKMRDDKCIPIARKVLAVMATDMIPPDANEKVDYNPVVKKILEIELEADLNVTTEEPYITQLMLGALSGLNKTVQGCEILPIDDVRYGAIATKILVILAESDITLGAVTPEQTDVDFAPVKEKLNALFAEEKLSWLEVKYIMDNVFETFQAVTGIVTGSVASSMKRAEAKAMNVEDMSDVSLKQLDAFLLNGEATPADAVDAGADQVAA